MHSATRAIWKAALRTIREARRISESATYPSETARLFNRYGPILREGLILGEEDAVNLDRPAEAIEAFQKALDMTEEAAAQRSERCGQPLPRRHVRRGNWARSCVTAIRGGRWPSTI